MFVSFLKCAADRYNIQSCDNSHVSNLPAFVSTGLMYHTTFKELPQFLKSKNANVLEVQASQCTAHSLISDCSGVWLNNSITVFSPLRLSPLSFMIRILKMIQERSSKIFEMNIFELRLC